MKKRAIIALALVALVCAAIGGCSSQGGEPGSPSGSAEAGSSDITLADTDELSVVYKGIEETPSIEAATLHLEWENRTDTKVTVRAENGTANGRSITIMSAIPTTMTAHGKSYNSLILSYAQFDAQSIEDVLSFSFDAVMRDDDSNEIARIPIRCDLG